MKDKAKTKETLIHELDELRQSMAALETANTNHKQSKQLLQALNQASIAMIQALTPEEIFVAVAEELQKLNLTCVVFLTDETQENLYPKYFSYSAKAIKTIEKLTGIERKTFSIPIKSVNSFRQIVQDKKPVFVEDIKNSLQDIPFNKPLHKFANQVVKLLNVPKAINAPLLIEGKIFGIFSVQGATLTEADMPTITAFTHQMAATWRKSQLFEQINRDIAERKKTEETLHQRHTQLQTAAEVSRVASSILDINELINQSVTLICERFDLYYVGLFLVDEECEYAVLRAGVGKPGYQMVMQEHKLEVGGESMIGQCVSHSEARIALDVGEEAVRFDNPFLPFTRSELALPLRSRGQTIGALTVQSTEMAAFDKTHIAVMQTMADQIAIAIDNARLYMTVQQELDERALTEEKLRKSEENLRITLDSIGDGVIATDTKGRIVRMNPTATQLTGWAFSEAWGKSLTDVFHIINAQTRKLAENPAAKVIKTGEIVTLANHTTLIAKDGTEHQIADSGAPIRDADGNINGVVLVFRDVTMEYQMRESLRESEERFRSIYENTTVGMYRTTPDGEILMANPALANMTGFDSFEELSQFNLEEEWYESKEHREEFKRLLEEKGVVKGLVSIWTKKDGPDIVVSESAKAFRDSDGNISYYEGTAIDITKRKHAEDELSKAKSYIDNIIDSMPSVLIGVDVEGNVTQWNWQAEQATGLTVKDALGRRIGKVFPRLSLEMERIKTTMQERQVQKDAEIPYQVDGETRYEDVTIYPLLTNGVEGVVIRVDDVTERVRLEELMIQSEKMLSIGGLAAGMAHEINNPLAGMMQNAAVLRNRLTGDIAANHRAAKAVGTDMPTIHAYLEERKLDLMLDNIRLSGSRAAKIIQNMLSFARKSESKFAPYVLDDLLDRTVELAHTDYNLKKNYDFQQIKIMREYEDDLPKIPCEETKIQQVFLNILKNGAEEMVKGTCGDAPPQFTLRTYKEENMACVEIIDNGLGMSELVRKRIFEPFFTTKP
ncbi:MAG: PAS domain S-box protein, partial [Chloroflexota bacterium]|nr:PAS domain S-box protein [Chloroflexota bacterium]